MKSKKLFRYIVILFIILLILAIAGKKAGWFGQEDTIKVAVEKVIKRTITETITASGKIQPEIEVEISPDVSGEIVELAVKEGDKVEVGEFLLKIKPDTYISIRDRTMASLNSSKARLAQVQAQFLKAELSYKRSGKLWEERTISQAEYEDAEAAYLVAKAEVDAAKYSVKSAEAALAEAEENLLKTSIYAPMAGTISKLNIERGERVVGTELMSGTPLMTIADLSRMEVLVEVNENDIVRVSMYDTAFIEVDAYLDEKFRGVVTQIANSAITTGLSADQVTNFEVKVLLLESSYAHLINENNLNPFRPGMSANVDIQTETRDSVISIPIQAVTTRADSLLAKFDSTLAELIDEDRVDELEVVFLPGEDQKAEFRIVKTGIQDNNFIEIREGLKAGEEVITAPYNAISRRLEPGSLVEVVPEKSLFKGK